MSRVSAARQDLGTCFFTSSRAGPVFPSFPNGPAWTSMPTADMSPLGRPIGRPGKEAISSGNRARGCFVSDVRVMTSSASTPPLIPPGHRVARPSPPRCHRDPTLRCASTPQTRPSTTTTTRRPPGMYDVFLPTSLALLLVSKSSLTLKLSLPNVTPTWIHSINPTRSGNHLCVVFFFWVRGRTSVGSRNSSISFVLLDSACV